MIKRKGHEMKLTPADESLIKRSEKLMRDMRDEINNDNNIEHLERIAENAQHNANELRKAFERYDLGTPEFELIRRTLVSMENLPKRVEREIELTKQARAEYEKAQEEIKETETVESKEENTEKENAEPEETKEFKRDVKHSEDLTELIRHTINGNFGTDNILMDNAKFIDWKLLQDRDNFKAGTPEFTIIHDAWAELDTAIEDFEDYCEAYDEEMEMFEDDDDESTASFYEPEINEIEEIDESETIKENPEESESDTVEIKDNEQTSDKPEIVTTEDHRPRRNRKTIPGHTPGHTMRLQETLAKRKAKKRGGKAKNRIKEKDGGHVKLPP